MLNSLQERLSESFLIVKMDTRCLKKATASPFFLALLSSSTCTAKGSVGSSGAVDSSGHVGGAMPANVSLPVAGGGGPPPPPPGPSATVALAVDDGTPDRTNRDAACPVAPAECAVPSSRLGTPCFVRRAALTESHDVSSSRTSLPYCCCHANLYPGAPAFTCAPAHVSASPPFGCLVGPRGREWWEGRRFWWWRW